MAAKAGEATLDRPVVAKSPVTRERRVVLEQAGNVV
jgi:hypothetical protein